MHHVVLHGPICGTKNDVSKVSAMSDLIARPVGFDISSLKTSVVDERP